MKTTTSSTLSRSRHSASGSSTPSRTAPEDKVPVPEKIAYGCGEPVFSFGSWLPALMASQVFNMSLGVSPILISIALVVFRLWDAITDPIMGWLTDNFRSRFGRRRPFIFISSFLVALVFPLMWMVSREWSSGWIIGWFIGIGLIYYTVQTVGNIPYQSLLLEMSPDYNERTSVASFRAFMAQAVGLAGGWIWYLTQLPVFADPETGAPDTLRGMQYVSIGCAAVFLIMALMPALFCKERYYEQAQKTTKEPLLKSIRKTLRSRPFLVLTGLVVALQIGNGMVQGFGAYVLTYYVYGGDQSGASFIQGWGSTLAALTGMCALPLITKLSKTIGKEKSLKWLLSSKLLLAIVIWFCYNPEYPWLGIFPLLLTMPLMTSLWMLFPSMLADIVDDDELKTGERREGNFSSIFAWLLKLSITIGFGLYGPLLQMTGFDASVGASQPDDVLFRMRFLLVAVPAVTCLLLLWILKLYPLSRERMHVIRTTLESRRGKITG